MSPAMAEKSKMEYYDDKPCRFIYHTTGPTLVAKTLKTRGYEPRVTVFSMCRPVRNLERHISLDGTGRVFCHRSGLKSYDVWSAFSMSYNTGDLRSPPSLAMPLTRFPPDPKTKKRSLAQLPPDPETKKRPRYAIKTTPAHAAEVDKQTISGDEENRFNIMQPVWPSARKPQWSSSQSENISQEAREAFDDIIKMFQAQRKSISVKVCLTSLQKNTQKYIRSRGKRRRLH